MIRKLQEIELSEINHLLSCDGIWESLDIDYIPPKVERIWTQYNSEYRLMIHKIYPCEEKDALFHPHPWKSAVRVLPIGNGTYKHNIGTLSEDGLPEILCTTEVTGGGMYYEMLDKFSCHSVIPINEPIYTIMLIGKPIWKEENGSNFYKKLKVSNANLKPLTTEKALQIRNRVKTYYNRRFN